MLSESEEEEEEWETYDPDSDSDEPSRGRKKRKGGMDSLVEEAITCYVDSPGFASRLLHHDGSNRTRSGKRFGGKNHRKLFEDAKKTAESDSSTISKPNKEDKKEDKESDETDKKDPNSSDH